MTASLGRRRVLYTAGGAVAVAAAGGGLLAAEGTWWNRASHGAGPALFVSGSPAPEPSGSPPAPPQEVAFAGADPATLVKISTTAWYSWALLDKATGRVTGSANQHQPNMTASMIKCWLAADYLRRAADAGKTPSTTRMSELRYLIRDSANAPASVLFAELGRAATITRMIQICGLTDSKAGSDWSSTRLSARDTCRLALAISAGTAAGPRWTQWLIAEMQAVRGGGNFGIRKAFPPDVQSTIAIKNGWITRAGSAEWNVNCLAIGSSWTMAVLTRYPSSRSMTVGSDLALKVASQLRLNVPLTA
jgi:hypothetical protein